MAAKSFSSYDNLHFIAGEPSCDPWTRLQCTCLQRCVKSFYKTITFKSIVTVPSNIFFFLVWWPLIALSRVTCVRNSKSVHSTRLSFLRQRDEMSVANAHIMSLVHCEQIKEIVYRSLLSGCVQATVNCQHSGCLSYLGSRSGDKPNKCARGCRNPVVY